MKGDRYQRKEGRIMEEWRKDMEEGRKDIGRRKKGYWRNGGRILKERRRG